MKNYRNIQLRPIAEGVGDDEFVRFRDLPNGHERRWRDGLTLYVERYTTTHVPTTGYSETTTIQIEQSAVVEWEDIRNACVVSYEEYNSDNPWDYNDLYEHELITWSNSHYLPSNVHVDLRLSQSCCRLRRCTGFITLPDVKEYCGFYDYTRAAGQSKQVAFEYAAQQRRDAIDQLREWYECGWSYYSVECVLGAYKATIHGYLSKEDAANAADHVAHEVVEEMEQDGFIIRGRNVKTNHQVKCYKQQQAVSSMFSNVADSKRWKKRPSK